MMMMMMMMMISTTIFQNITKKLEKVTYFIFTILGMLKVLQNYNRS